MLFLPLFINTTPYILLKGFKYKTSTKFSYHIFLLYI